MSTITSKIAPLDPEDLLDPTRRFLDGVPTFAAAPDPAIGPINLSRGNIELGNVELSDSLINMAEISNEVGLKNLMIERNLSPDEIREIGHKLHIEGPEIEAAILQAQNEMQQREQELSQPDIPDDQLMTPEAMKRETALLLEAERDFNASGLPDVLEVLPLGQLEGNVGSQEQGVDVKKVVAEAMGSAAVLSVDADTGQKIAGKMEDALNASLVGNQSEQQNTVSEQHTPEAAITTAPAQSNSLKTVLAAAEPAVAAIAANPAFAALVDRGGFIKLATEYLSDTGKAAAENPSVAVNLPSKGPQISGPNGGMAA